MAFPDPAFFLTRLNMYEYSARGSVIDDPDEVRHHRGSALDFLRRHEADAARAISAGIRGAKEIAPHLIDRIADARTMRLAWQYLAEKGGQAPGPDHRRYRDYTSTEIWEWCRCLASAVRDGTYRPSPERVLWIDKASKKGSRPIVLLTIADRVVQRAIFIILQPVLDPLFSPHALGYRPRLGPWHALSVAEHITLTQGRRVWLAEDVRDAFQHVPISRLIQVFEKILPAGNLIELLERVLPAQTLPGLRQGGSLSPLALNVYMNHVLDRPWLQRHGHLPLIRVADDLLVLCRSTKQAERAREEMVHLLIPAGLPLKEVAGETTIHDLGSGEAADWLGFTIKKTERSIAYGLAERSWKRLDGLFAIAHTKSDAPIRAVQTVIRPWLWHRAPSHDSEDRDLVCSMIAACARTHAFEEVPNADELLVHWEHAAGRWRQLRKGVRGTYRRTGSVV